MCSSDHSGTNEPNASTCALEHTLLTRTSMLGEVGYLLPQEIEVRVGVPGTWEEGERAWVQWSQLVGGW